MTRSSGVASAGSWRGRNETKDEANPRFVIVSPPSRAQCKARYLYEKVYCGRGGLEPDQGVYQLDLYADRTSTARHHAGQPAALLVCLDGLLGAAVRLAPHRPAPHAFAESDLRHQFVSELARSAPRCAVSARRIKVPRRLASACPAAHTWGCAAKRLAAAANARASPA